MASQCLIKSYAAPPFYKNGYLVACADTKEALLIDPGDEVEEIARIADAHRWSVKYIVLTHAHVDHISGVGFAKERYQVPIYLHKDDLPLYQGLPQQGQWVGIALDPPPPVDHFLAEGDLLRWGNLQAEVIHTPGHTPGGVCLKIGEVLMAGDTLFAGSIGRTDLPGGDYDALIESIKTRLLVLPDPTRVFSGHGPETTIGQERRTNPFLQ
ncbi:MAG TPA: MBL fold metallo-hydrolase [Acidobacteriota bacterium]|jgi:glyoxylase-like metal-dependent hydrolase (beta-lactamase superfamily II)